MRLENWPLLLSNYLKEMKNEPFKWGVNDCILFGAKGIEAITGNNYYQEYIGYNTEEQAKELLNKNGGFQGIIGKHLGQSHRNIFKAKRGDMVLLKMPEFTCGLIDDTGQFVAAPGKDGIKRVSLSKVWRIWSI